jgi:hypothetical protein
MARVNPPVETTSRGGGVGNSTSISKLRIIGSTAVHAARWIACGALLGTACGSLYGLLFAGLGALLEAEPGTIVATALYFAACGTIAAGLVGGLAAILHDKTDSAAEECFGAVETPPRCAAIAREVAAVSRPPPVNRLSALSSVNRQHVERAASRNPSRN